MVKVRLSRGQVGKATGVDTSRKSGGALGIPFAPTWSLVMGYKRGQISWDKYRRVYLSLLDNLSTASVTALYDEGVRRGGDLCVLCYCSDGQSHCHTFLLMEWLVERFPDLFTIRGRE